MLMHDAMLSKNRKSTKQTGMALLKTQVSILVIMAVIVFAASPVMFVVAAGSNGAIWTNFGPCGSPQDVNQYEVADHVYLNGNNFDASELLAWTITGKPGGASADPNIVVASGNVTADANGAFCFDAYTIANDDDGEYQVKVGTKGDNYSVDGQVVTPPPPPVTPPPVVPPPPAPQPTPPPAPTPTPPPVVPPPPAPQPTPPPPPTPQPTPPPAPQPTPPPPPAPIVIDLAIDKSVDDATPSASDTIVYTIELVNNGPDNATNVEVSDLLPSDVDFVSANPSQGSYDEVTGIWTVGNLNFNDSVTLEITVTVDSGTAGNSFDNTANASASETDSNPANNTDTVSAKVNKPSSSGHRSGGSRVTPPPAPQVLGETTETPAVLPAALPRTGQPAWMLLTTLFGAIPFLRRK